MEKIGDIVKRLGSRVAGRDDYLARCRVRAAEISDAAERRRFWRAAMRRYDDDDARYAVWRQDLKRLRDRGESPAAVARELRLAAERFPARVRALGVEAAMLDAAETWDDVDSGRGRNPE